MTPIIVIDYVLRVLVVVGFGLLSLHKGLVDKTGLVAGFAIGLTVIMFGGWNWFLVLLSFHIMAGLVTKWRYDYKRSLGVAEEKGGARSWKNVLANGIVAASMTVFEAFVGGQIWALAYLAAVAAAMGDTLATEIGLLNPTPPRLITKPWKIVEPGTSGGVSFLGYTASALAGAIVGFLGYILGVVPEASEVNFALFLLVVVVSTIIGVTVDSIIGATVQAQYRCTVCGKLTEKPVHCGKPARLVKGYEWIDNHVVNILGIGSAALAVIVLSAILGLA